MITNKYFFNQFKKEIQDEHEMFETHTEQKEVTSIQCNHKGKVKAVPGGIRCVCGAGWQGSQLNVLLDYFVVV